MPIMVWDRRHVGNVDYGRLNFFGGLRVGFWKMKGNPLTDQLVAFARRLQESFSVKHHDLSLTGGNQAGLFELSQSVCNCRAVHSQHLGEQGLRDLQDVAVGPVIHHEQPQRAHSSCCFGLLVTAGWHGRRRA